jgi:hypothetical protein
MYQKTIGLCIFYGKHKDSKCNIFFWLIFSVYNRCTFLYVSSSMVFNPNIVIMQSANLATSPTPMACEIWHMRSPTGLWQFFQLWLLFLHNSDLVFHHKPLALDLWLNSQTALLLYWGWTPLKKIHTEMCIWGMKLILQSLKL